MKRWMWVLVGVAIVTTAAVAFVALGRRPEFTTSSPAALAELDAALAAQMKLYGDEAKLHLERAVKLDPDFVFARLLLCDYLHADPQRQGQLMDELAKADLGRLTERERFLVQRALVLHGGKSREATKLADQYLADNPDDPWVLNIKANQAWGTGDMATAESLFRRLIEVSPNWVVAYNMLGYSAMYQGKFAEAEEHFISYRFIAPDQANPHDSLGELYILLGRHDEAIASLEKALAIKPDFWASYGNLVTAYILRRDWVAAEEVIKRVAAVKSCPPGVAKQLGCVVELHRLLCDRAWQELLEAAEKQCPPGLEAGDYAVTLKHLALCEMGRFDDAKAFEDKVREAVTNASSGKASSEMPPEPSLLIHLEGVRLALSGNLVEAEKRLHEADAKMTYRSAGLGLLKLANELEQVEVLRAQGNDAEASRLLSQVRAVNAPLANDFEADGRRLLGLPRG